MDLTAVIEGFHEYVVVIYFGIEYIGTQPAGGEQRPENSVTEPFYLLHTGLNIQQVVIRYDTGGQYTPGGY